MDSSNVQVITQFLEGRAKTEKVSDKMSRTEPWQFEVVKVRHLDYILSVLN